MDKATRRAIHDDVDNSTIPEEMKVMYLMANACQLMVEHVYNRVERVYARHGFKTGENELLTGLNDYCKAVKQAGFHFYNRIEPQICNATWGLGRDENNPDGGATPRLTTASTRMPTKSVVWYCYMLTAPPAAMRAFPVCSRPCASCPPRTSSMTKIFPTTK